MAFRIIPRSEWGARHGSSGIKRRVGGLEKWLHHSVTNAPGPNATLAQDIAAMRAIEDIGKERFGSYGFPYTFAYMPSGRIFEGHPIDEVGAHTQGHNTAGTGHVLVGNYETDRPTDAQIEAVAWNLQEGKRRGYWGYAELDGGHRDTKATACPGRHAYAVIDDINRLSRGPDITEDDDMPLSNEDVEKVADAVWHRAMFTLNKNQAEALWGHKEGERVSAGSYIQRVAVLADRAHKAASDDLDVKALAALVPDSLAKAVADELHRRLGG